MEVTLKRERPVLTVNVGDERLYVPLTFTREEYTQLGTAEDKTEAIDAFFEKYLGDIIHELGDDDYMALLGAWSDARKEVGAPGMGEPSASPK